MTGSRVDTDTVDPKLFMTHSAQNQVVLENEF